MRYHEAHHSKIVGLRVESADPGNEEDAEVTGMDEGDFYSEAPPTMHITVSIVYQGGFKYDPVNPIDLDSISEAGHSQTSYAPSINEGSDILQVPPPPQGFDSGPFQCPYCFRIVKTTNLDSRK